MTQKLVCALLNARSATWNHWETGRRLPHPAEGYKIHWPEVSRLDDPEMNALMKQVVNLLYTFYLKVDDPDFQRMLDRWVSVAGRLDEPEIDEFYKLKLPE